MTQSYTMPAPYMAQVPVWFVTALGEIGVKEVPGKEHNPRILEYFKTTTYPQDGLSDEVHWCSAAMNWVFVNSGMRGTGSAAARSWLTYGKPLTAPRLGCIVVLWSGAPDGRAGHVGLYVKHRGQTVWTLGGNQGNEFSIAPYPLSRHLAYRTP